jgi:hypothetical protein
MRFGYASAEAEGTRDPNLLIKGYLDPGRLVVEALDGHRFVFLGNKGSGKSAIARHLTLTKSNYDFFITTIYLADFPYQDLTSVRLDNSKDKYRAIWGSLLLLVLLESFYSDNGASHERSEQFTAALGILKEAGFLPHADFAEAIEKTHKLAIKFSAIPGVEAAYDSTRKGLPGIQTHDAPFFFQRLKALTSGFHSESKHILFVDGLDDSLSVGSVVLEPLSALLRETDRLNTFFRDKRVPAKIIVLCRTELFDRLPGSNNNKIRQDSAMQIDWYQDPREPNRASLIRLANLRASLSASTKVDLFASVFPPQISYRASAQFLLDQTRHTPRDFLQLLRHLQYFAGDRERISEYQVSSGIGSYSRDSFLPEIIDELDAYFDRDIIEYAFRVFRKLKKRRFRLREIEAICNQSGSIAMKTLEPVLAAMFDCSALGNYSAVSMNGRSQLRYTFRYRNRGSEINLDEGLVFHRGLWPALNLLPEENSQSF